MDKNVLSTLLVPVMGQQQFDAVSYVHDLITAGHAAGYDEGFATGNRAGLSEALRARDTGYLEGVRDTQNIVGAQAAGAYNAGYDEGYDDGAADDVSAVDVYQAGYDAGHVAGWDAAIDEDWNYGSATGDIADYIDEVTPTNTPFMKKHKLN